MPSKLLPLLPGPIRQAAAKNREDGMPNQKILLVDDEEALIEILAPFLARFEFSVEVAMNGLEALEKAAADPPDLIILDIQMPKLDGWGVLRKLRKEDNQVPIILLSKIGQSTTRAQALEEGADDYLNKPFDAFEVLARVRAVLRRSRDRPQSSAGKLSCHGLVLDCQTRQVFVDGQEIPLYQKSVDLLEYMLKHAGQVLDRERLLDAIWGYDDPSGTRVVDNQVYNLRDALGDTHAEPRFIVTIRGQGYRLIGPVERIR